MRNRVFVLLLLLLIFTGAQTWAEDAGADRDPFFSDGPRTKGTSTAVPESWGRDPFSRPFEGPGRLTQSPATRVRGKNLTGVIYGKEVRVAIIGGETFREGGMVGDQKLVDIRRHSVVLMNSGGGTEEVFLEDFSIRR